MDSSGLNTMKTNNKVYRLAIAHMVSGDVVPFGPLMSMPMAESKRKAMSEYGYTCYIVNVTAE